DPDTLSRASGPFFTTREGGEGTGMGLSVVLGVRRSFDGDLQVESSPGKGSTFKLYLPTTRRSVAGKTADSPKLPTSGTERILFVDDEQMLTKMAKKLLGRLGYTVTCLNGSLGALQFIKEKGADIDILITDQTMPNLTGIELAKEALKLKKDLPIILCTGNGNEVNPKRIEAIGISRSVLKPFGTLEISTSIREVLDQRKTG
ncbi:MAG: response regulator, partial [Syntrophales bacterium LBB04]|nr:response regulator [Syntrophales bacterium LBB04]